MKIIFLGTNGWYDTKTGNTVCVLINTDKEYVILDAGNGLCKIDKYIKENKPIRLFISHFHLDHIIGLHALNKFNFRQGIDIFGPMGLKKLFKIIINKPYSLPLKLLRTKVRLNELDGKKKIVKGLQFKKLRHSSLCYGYRFFLENKVIAYCIDTGICNNLVSLVRNADLAIMECSLKSGQKNVGWPHLSPQDAALVAKRANVKMLALVHFDASIYKTLRERKGAQRQAQKVFSNTFTATDGLCIKM